MMINPFPNKEVDFNVLKEEFTGFPSSVDRELFIIGESEKGEILEPTTTRNFNETYKVFGDGSLIEMARSIYQVIGEVPLSFIRVDWEDHQKIVHLLRYLEFDYLLIDPSLSLIKKKELIIMLIDVLKERMDYGSKLSHIFFSVERTFNKSEYRDLRDLFKGLYSYYETNAGVFISVILNQVDDFYAHAMYAALAISQEVYESPVNKKLYIPGVTDPIDILYELTPEEEDEYKELSVVTLRDTFHHGAIFSSNYLMSSDDKKSQYRLFTSVKAVIHVMNILRGTTEKMVGFMHKDLYDEMDKAVSYTILYILSQKKVRDIKYQLVEVQPGHFDLNIVILPYHTIHYIEANIKVRVRS